MISCLSRIVVQCFSVRASARRLIASLLMALLLLSPFTPLAPVMIVPAKADKVDECLKSIGAAANLAKTLAQDLPGLTACGGQVAGGDVLMAAIGVILAGYAVTHNGSFGGGNQVDACNAELNGVVLELIMDGLKTFMDAGSASGAASDGVGSVLANVPGVSVVLGEAQCACSIVAGALDIAKATVDLAQDAEACSEVLVDFAVSAGKVIGSGIYAAGEYVECELNPGACGGANYGTQTNDVYGQCHAGPLTMSLHRDESIDAEHGDVVKTWYSADCSCPQGTHEQDLVNNQLFCKCDSPSLAYDGSSCKACDGYVGTYDGTCHACTHAPPGLVAFGSNAEQKCHFKPMCDSPQVYDFASNSCMTCQANFFADDKPVIDSRGDSINAGRCTACRPGQTSVPEPRLASG